MGYPCTTEMSTPNQDACRSLESPDGRVAVTLPAMLISHPVYDSSLTSAVSADI